MTLVLSMTTDTDAPKAPSSAPARAPSKAAPKTSPAPPKADRLPPFHVMLHNDDHHDMMEVVESIVMATPVGKKAAAMIMLAAHFKGQAIVVTTHKELAEFYRDRLRSRGLVATIEPAG